MVAFLNEPVRTWLERLEGLIAGAVGGTMGAYALWAGTSAPNTPTQVALTTRSVLGRSASGVAALDGATLAADHSGAFNARQGIVCVTDREYGTGTGTGGDDTAAILAAIAACPVGGVVLFPPPTIGYYSITGASLAIAKNISLIGTQGQVRIVQNSALPVVTLTTGGSPFDGMRIANLYLDGGTRGIEMTGLGLYRQSSIRNCTIGGYTDAGLYFTDTGIIGLEFTDLNVGGGDYGLFLSGDQSGNHAHFHNCRFTATAIAGARIESTNSHTPVRFSSCIFEGNISAAISTRNAGLQLDHCYFESNGVGGNGTSDIRADLKLDTSNSEDAGGFGPVTLNGCYFAPPHANQDHTRITFEDNLIDLQVFGGRVFPGDEIDAKSFACTIVQVNGIPFTVTNFTGGALTQVTSTQISLFNGLGQFGYYGSPEGVISARIGSVCANVAVSGAAAVLYKETNDGGSTGWVRRDLMSSGFLYLETLNNYIAMSSAAGSPETILTGNAGSIFACALGIYRKASGSGNTGWVRHDEFGSTIYVDSIAGDTKILQGTADPSAGGGVAATIGSLYLRANGGTTGELWLKTGTAATAWTMK